MKKRSIVWIFVGIAIVVLILSVFLSYRGFTICTALATGWFSFLQRTLPRLTWNWDLIGLAILSAAIILFIGHKLLSGLSKNIAAARGTQWRWPWKWTWSSLVALLLLFLVGMAVGGTVHQIGWIASSPEPWFEKKPFSFVDVNNMKQIQLAFRIAYEDEGGDLGKIRAVLWDSKSDYLPSRDKALSMLQKYAVLVVVQKDQSPGVIIFPREPILRNRIGGFYSWGDEGGSLRSKELSEFIKLHQANLLAL